MGVNIISPIQLYAAGNVPTISPDVYGDSEPDSQPVNLLNQKHPSYEIRYDTWLDLTLLYEGGSAIKARAERLLKKRPREDEEVYGARIDGVTYQDILGVGLGWYGAAMFDQSPEFFFNGKPGSPDFTDFLQSCDGLGTTFVDFFKRSFQGLLTYGADWVLTDLKALKPGEAPPVSLEDERTRGLLDPHLVHYTPLNVINWQEDEMGELEWAVVKTEGVRQKFLEEKQLVDTWYYYDRQEYRVYEDVRKKEEVERVGTDSASNRMAKLIRRGKHGLSHVDRLPLRRLMLSEGLWLANRAYLLMVDHFNQDNTLKWALFMSNLAMPVIIGDVDFNNQTFAEAGYLQFPTGTEYSWSEPEGKSFVHSAKRVESLREECFRSMYLQAQGRSMKATPAMQSGRSKILEMAPAKQILSGMGDDLRRHMQDVLRDVGDAMHKVDVEPDVRGFSFQEDMTTEEVFAVTSLLSLKIPSKTFEKYVQKKVVKAWMQDANRAEIAKCYDEVDEGPTMEEQEKKEFKDRIKMAQEEMGSALNKVPKPIQPPGRGGAGASPNSEGKGKVK